MSSPPRASLQVLIPLDRSQKQPLFKQIAVYIRTAIQEGTLAAGLQLPGSRELATVLGVHRKTVIAAYEELQAEGVVNIVADRGTFVQEVPSLVEESSFRSYAIKSNFQIRRNRLLDLPLRPTELEIELTDGQPDVRLAPMDKMMKVARLISKRQKSSKLLGYAAVEGNVYYRRQLANFLQETRSMSITEHHILTTRGIHMGLYLTAATLIEKGDVVIVAELGNYLANMILQQVGADLVTIPVDHEGIVIEALEKIVQSRRIKSVYVTSHHHYPTTVTLSFERKLALLALSKKHGFSIIEDDQDYDFHFAGRPQMPLASLDRGENVIYLSSFCKVLAPGLRAGYIVAPTDFIEEVSKLRRIIDRQSDIFMEQGIGELLYEGEIQRHLKKVKKIYQQRRDHLADLLMQELEEYMTFTPPQGGLAFWTIWHKKINLMKLSKRSHERGLFISPTMLYQTKRFSAMRLGFGNLSESEMETAVQLLRTSLSRG